MASFPIARVCVWVDADFPQTGIWCGTMAEPHCTAQSGIFVGNAYGFIFVRYAISFSLFFVLSVLWVR